MGTHPNAILLCTLTPDGLSRKTYRDILLENGSQEEEDPTGTSIVRIDGTDYHIRVMELDYDKEFQVSAKEGDILVNDFLTYGYGEQIEWSKAEAQKQALEAWAIGVCERHHCSYNISITANYW